MIGWVECCNVDARTQKERAYLLAARRMGIDIKLGEPVDCPARAMCGGMHGVYMKLEQYSRETKDRFTDEMWKALSDIKGGIDDFP